MTDRYHSLVVVLDRDIRSDDAQSTIEAIKHIRGVMSVKPEVADIMSLMAVERARRELGEKLWNILYPKDAK